MLNSYEFTIQLESGECEVFVSPLLLQANKRPELKTGKISILYFYAQLRDNAYKMLLNKEVSSEKYRSDKYIINCGQDFEKYYLGSLNVDFDTNSYGQWKGHPSKMTDKDVKLLAETLFDPNLKSRKVVMFTPTRASDFNFQILPKKTNQLGRPFIKGRRSKRPPLE